MRLIEPVLIVCVLLIATACEVGPRSGIGLRLPNGDVARGKQAFRDLGCTECHSIAGESDSANRPTGDVNVVLGGRAAHIETHGELVTSIVNPSHGIGRRYPRDQVTEGGLSKMKNVNETMTVAQLIDVTEYLQSKYEIELNLIYGP